MLHSPKAFIFDLDGVITDTAEFHYLAWKKLAEGLNISIDREFNEQLKGISRIESLDRILHLASPSMELTMAEKETLANQKNNDYLQLIEQIQPSSILPGIVELLESCKRQQIKIALGSASENATTIIRKLELMEYFDFIVDASKVKKGKPDPETFTTAADFLDVSYTDCIGLEDAIAGVEAINRAQMFSVGIGSYESLYKADYVVEDTSELSFQEIINAFQLKHTVS